MRVPQWIMTRLHMKLLAVSLRREPDEFIGGKENVYMKRWFLIPKNRWCNVMLHNFKRSDDDRAQHDHPWSNASILIYGNYIEHVGSKTTMREQGHLYLRSAKTAHRVQLLTDQDGEIPVLTMFITGPKTREWGFLCPKGWRHNKIFCSSGDVERTVGRGCGDV